MNGWTDERTDGRADRRAEGWTDGLMDGGAATEGRTNGRLTNGWTDERTDDRTYSRKGSSRIVCLIPLAFYEQYICYKYRNVPKRDPRSTLFRCITAIHLLRDMYVSIYLAL